MIPFFFFLSPINSPRPKGEHQGGIIKYTSVRLRPRPRVCV